MTEIKKLMLETLSVFILLFLTQTLLQWSSGAFSSEFGAYPDEAAHYVTGLMVRDYVSDTKWESPMTYAENYYAHYPKVAFGHWPPVFYVIQSVWMLLFSHLRISLLFLMIFLTALLALTVYLSLRKAFGYPAAFGAAILLLIFPLVQKYSGMIMAEIPVALFSFWAVLCFGMFMETEKPLWSAGFGICAALTILTKGNGWALGFVPILAVCFSRRFYLLKSLSFWYPAAIVAVCCGPWYAFTLNMVKNGWQSETPSLNFTVTALGFFSYEFVKIVGWGLSLLIALGFVKKIILPFRDRGAEGKWAALGALPLSVCIFHALVPAGMEDRHLITAIPALLMFLAAGIGYLCDLSYFQMIAYKRKAVIVMLSLAIVFSYETCTIPGKAWYGFGSVVRDLLSKPEFHDSVMLVSSDERGEGMFISEFAMQEPRPGHIVLRASKMLASSRWSGAQYKLLCCTPENIMNYIKEISVEVVVIDESLPEGSRLAHHTLLEETIKCYPRRWELSGDYPVTRKGVLYENGIKVYRLKRAEKQRADKIRIDLTGIIGKILEIKTGSRKVSEVFPNLSDERWALLTEARKQALTFFR
jgi:4-amino-4-deoxy-L-arabinose transferase-like glycosyltransferase